MLDPWGLKGFKMKKSRKKIGSFDLYEQYNDFNSRPRTVSRGKFFAGQK